MLITFIAVGILMAQTWPAQAQVWTPTPEPTPGPPVAIEADANRQVSVLGRFSAVPMLQVEGLSSITGLTHPFNNLAFPNVSYYMTGCDSAFMWNPPSATYMWTTDQATDINDSKMYFSRYSRFNARWTTSGEAGFHANDIQKIVISGFAVHNEPVGQTPILTQLWGRTLVLEPRTSTTWQLRWSGREGWTQPGIANRRYMELQLPAEYDIHIELNPDPTQSDASDVRPVVTAVSQTSNIRTPTWTYDAKFPTGYVLPTTSFVPIGNYLQGDDTTVYTGDAIWSAESIAISNQQTGGRYVTDSVIIQSTLQPPIGCDVTTYGDDTIAWTRDSTIRIGQYIHHVDTIITPNVQQDEFICNTGFDKSPIVQDYAQVPRCPFTDIPIVTVAGSGDSGDWASETFGLLVGTDGAAGITSEALMWLVWSTLTMTGYYVGFILARWLLLAAACALIAGMFAIAMTPLAPIYILFSILGAIAAGLTIPGSIGRQL